MVNKLWLSVLMLLCTTSALASERWLIVTQNELLKSPGDISIEVIKPNHVKDWPNTLDLILTGKYASEHVLLTLDSGQNDEARRIYQGRAQSEFNGDVRAELTNLVSNRLLMSALGSEQSTATNTNAQLADADVEVEKLAEAESESDTILIPEPKEDRTITANEPLYFIVGSNSERDFDARFQLSFKYRPFDPEASVARFIPYASNLYFAYTQTSIWDLGSESSPFKDTSYRPSLYYNWEESGKGLNPMRWKFGVEHESNGRDGVDSRSFNTAFVQPFWDVNFSGGEKLTFMPKIYYYLEKDDNRDINHYRGYIDWIARYGRDDAAILTAMYRQGTDGYAQGQVDLSYPISDKIFGRTGTFLHFQLLGGYGETLIDYNKRSDTQLRIGISIAR
jgi:phospholipase A1/A2